MKPLSLRKISFLILLLILFPQGQGSRLGGQGSPAQWFTIKDFSGGIKPRMSPARLPVNTAIEMDNINVDGGTMVQRDGFSVWPATYPDTSDAGFRGLYEFYNARTNETQVLVVSDSTVLWKADTSAYFRYIGTSAGNVTILQGDSVVYGQGTEFAHQVFPETGDDWVLHLWTGGHLYTYDVYRVINDNKLYLDEAQSDAVFMFVDDYVLSPKFSVSNNIQFATWGVECFIADGEHPVRRWRNHKMNPSYIVDSATIESFTWDTASIVIKIIDDPLSASDDKLQEYADYHYCLMAMDDKDNRNRYMPIYEIAHEETTTVKIKSDGVDYDALRDDPKIYVVLPISEGFSFEVDTLFQGTVDSMRSAKTLMVERMDILSFYGVVSLGNGVDSVDVDLPGDYMSVDSFQVFLMDCTNDYTHASLRLVKKIDANTFRIVRPSWLSQVPRAYQWLTVGRPATLENRDSLRCWQWGNYLGTYSSPDTVYLNSHYMDRDSFAVTGNLRSPETSSDRFWMNRLSDSSLCIYTDAGSEIVYYTWLSMGAPDTTAESNSLQENFLVYYGIDTIFNRDLLKPIYFDKPWFEDETFGLTIGRIDSLAKTDADSIALKLLVCTKGSNGFSVRRKDPGADKDFIFSWLAVGYKAVAAESLYVDYTTLVYDYDELLNNTYESIYELDAAPCLFKLTGGPESDKEWWSDGTPASLYSDINDSMTLRVLKPSRDYSDEVINIVPDDSSQYVVLRLTQYPPSQFVSVNNNRLWFAKSEDFSSRMWWSEVNDPNDVSTANSEEIGGDDGDELTGFSARQNYTIGYKRNHIYQITGDFSSVTSKSILLKSQNYGLWSDGALIPHQAGDIGLNRTGLFLFNGSSLQELSLDTKPFFLDSLNLSYLNKVRGVVYEDRLLFSYPNGSDTYNSATLILTLDQPQIWTTWSFSPSAYLVRRSPGQYDSLLVTPADTSLIYIYGGDTDAGDSIQFSYQSPFLDFNMPTTQKSIDRFYVSCAMAAHDSLAFEVYEDSLGAVVWADTITTPVGVTEWRTIIRAIPASVDNAYRFSFGLRSVGFSDNVKVDAVGVRVKPVHEGMVPQG